MSYEPPQPPGPPQNPGGMPEYSGSPQFGGGGMPQTHPNGTTILVLGIVGLVLCAPLGIVSWVMGNKALKEIDASGRTYTNRGNIQAGKIIGIIAVVLWVLGILAFLIFGGLTAATYSTSFS